MVFLNILIVLIVGFSLLILFYLILLGYQYYKNKGRVAKKSRYFVEPSDSIISNGDEVELDNEENNILQAIPSYKEVFEGSIPTVNRVEMATPQSFEASDHVVIQWLNSLKTIHQKNQEYLRKESAMPIFSMLKK